MTKPHQITKEQALEQLLDRLQDGAFITSSKLQEWYAAGLTAQEVSVVTEQFSQSNPDTE